MWTCADKLLFGEVLCFQNCIHFLGVSSIRYRQIFLGGPRTKMKNWSEDFLRASAAQKMWCQTFFTYGGLFFVVVTLKPSKTVKFLKKRYPKIFSPAESYFFDKLVGRFYEIGRSNRGEGVKNIFYPPLEKVWFPVSNTFVHFIFN